MGGCGHVLNDYVVYDFRYPIKLSTTAKSASGRKLKEFFIRICPRMSCRQTVHRPGTYIIFKIQN